MKKIVQEGNTLLRQIAKPVAIETLPNKAMDKLISDMQEALIDKPNGVALAAPQIGVSKRVFVVSEKVTSDTKSTIPLVYINPTITKRSKKVDTLEEGCLSIPHKYGSVPRAQRVTVTAYDHRGKVFTWGASGLLAQIFQHEIDHLNGILYIDTATETHEMQE
jgi:peptide deformylase